MSSRYKASFGLFAGLFIYAKKVLVKGIFFGI
jgi:hypothetical protein